MRRLLVPLALALAAAAAAPAAADEEIATLTDPTAVDAYAGRLVWSEPDAATGRYRLMTRAGSGPVEPVAVPERSEPFDVDLGPDAAGRTVAVYSRCGGGCDLYRYDFATGHERRLARPSTAGRESLPALWGGRVAFVRSVRGRDRLYVQGLAGGPAREVRGGRGTYDEIDLRGERVAFVRDRTTRGGDRTEYTLLVGRGGRTARLVDRAASGLLSSVAIRKPRFAGGALVYALVRFGAAGNRFLRYDLATRRTTEALGRHGLLAAAFDRARFLYLRTDFDEDPTVGCRGDAQDPSRCTLALTGPIAFR
jgi:hypothetical protein